MNLSCVTLRKYLIMFVFWTVIIWIQFDSLSKDVNLLGHLNWDKFTPRNNVIGYFKMIAGQLV